MSREEAKTVLAERLSRYRELPYDRLVTLVGSCEVEEFRGNADVVYQLEFDILWDDRQGGDIRVIGGIDGGVISAITPMTDCFIKAPDGSFVDE